MKFQGWFPLELTGLISLHSKGLSRVFSSTTIGKYQFFGAQPSSSFFFLCSAFFMVQLSHPYITTRKTIPLTIRTYVSKVMFLLFNKMPRFVIAFLLRRKHLLTSWGWNLHDEINVLIIINTKAKSRCHLSEHVPTCPSYTFLLHSFTITALSM